MTTVAEELAALRTLDAAALTARYVALYGREPRSRNRDHLFRKVAWKVQERAFGGLSGAARKRLDGFMAEITLPGAEPVAKDRNGLAVGTVLTREWRGTTVRCTVRDNGYEHEGVLYASLSAAARAVTGTAWSGPAWFGLRERAR
jgi:hypothetical protein